MKQRKLHFTLQKAWSYFTKVYGLPARIKMLTDDRAWHHYRLADIASLLLSMFLLQYRSLRSFLSMRDGQRRRLRHLLGDRRGGEIPTADVLIGAASRLRCEQLRELLFGIVRKLRRNKIFERNKIDGYRVAAVDGIETNASQKKECPSCLSRTLVNGKEERFHRYVVLLSIGGTGHFALGATMLKPRDGSEKQEGELTGAKRLITETAEHAGSFADVIAADALYFNAPFLNAVREAGMHAVVRLSDPDRLPQRRAERVIRNGHYRPVTFHAKNAEGHPIQVTACDIPGIEMEHYAQGTVRLVRFTEHNLLRSALPDKEMWVSCTDGQMPVQTVWKIAHARWEIENNGFHVLSEAYHAKHLYCHTAAEQLFFLTLIAYNLRESYLFCLRGRDFPGSRYTQADVTEEWKDSVLLEVLLIRFEAGREAS